MDAIEAIHKRRSVRRFKPDPVSRELLSRLVDAGRVAPSANNEQGWEFIVVTDERKRRIIAAATDVGRFIADAPACIAVLSRPGMFCMEDGTAATENILIAATALGLGSCWVHGGDRRCREGVLAACRAPGDCRVVSLIAVGYADESPSPGKRSLEEVLHWETF